jgi:hypothetical protein
VDQHQDELVGDLLEARESRKSVSAAARTSDTKSEFVAFCPFLPRAGQPEHEMGDLSRDSPAEVGHGVCFFYCQHLSF